MHKKNRSFHIVPLSILLLLLVIGGCSASKKTQTAEALACPNPQWSAFDGHNQYEVTWATLLADVFEADVIVAGEQHDNAAGHELERRLTLALLERYPNSAVAMEMFERDEQAFVDLYLSGQIEAETLVKITDSADWGGGDNSWFPWYQPIVDIVKEYHGQGAYLKAANCPRAFVQLARLEGFAVFDSLPGDRLAHVTVPNMDVNDTSYHDRFVAKMSPAVPFHAAEAMQKRSPPSNKKAAHKAIPSMASAHRDTDAFFRAQQTWDASMAASVLEAKRRHPKVLLLVGEFHMAYEGGLIKRLQYKNPALKIASISIIQGQAEELNPRDKGRAHYVIYTR